MRHVLSQKPGRHVLGEKPDAYVYACVVCAGVCMCVSIVHIYVLKYDILYT